MQPLHTHFPDPITDLEILETPSGFSASNNTLYAMAEFGRDQRQLASDALIFNPSIARKVVLSLVKRQAWKRNDITEAQPGKFHHEHRQLFVNGKRVPQHSELILQTLSKKWGGTQEKVTYYGSVDITPDTISLIADIARHDKSFLSEKVINQDRKKEISIKESARQGIQWLQDRILFGPTQTPHNKVVENFLVKSNLNHFVPTYHHMVLNNWDKLHHRVVQIGKHLPLSLWKIHQRVKLLEFQRVNQQGIAYQGWMDGGTSLIHSTPGVEGLLANYNQPIATIEMQASAIDSLEKASFLFPKKAKHFRKLADEIRNNTIEHMWMSESGYFAMGIDRDKQGSLRQIATWGANVGEILNSTFFDTFTKEERIFYISAIIRRLFSDEFLTDAGIRTRAKSYAYLSDVSDNHNQPNSLLDLWDYQGSETSWIVQTGRIAEGLRRQGFYTLAQQLDNRILNTVNISGYNLEYVYVGARGNLEHVIAYNVQDKALVDRAIIGKHTQPQVIEIAATNVPELTQTWTASKVAVIKHRLKDTSSQPITQKNSWQWDLEQGILENLAQSSRLVDVMTDKKEILEKRATSPLFVVNMIEGEKLADQLVQRTNNQHH